MRIVLLLMSVLFSVNALCQVQLKGQVTDNDGEQLPQAHILVYPDSITTTSGNNGKFTVRVTPGGKTVRISYVGYEILHTSFRITKDSTIDVVLKPEVNQLKEVVIKGERDYQQEIFDQNRTSTYVLSEKDINAIPVLGGEADVIKTLQLLPGTLRGIEGTSDLFVRGGAADQNLVMLDGAPIYNTSHLFGFLSVFNPDIIDKVEAINGGFPAQYGGRLSSILDVQSKSLIPAKTRISGDIGLIASRLMIEQPVIQNKLSLWVTARRTYIDQVVRTIGEDLPYFFYDVNAKIIFKPTVKDQVVLSHYGGEDILDLYRDRNGDGDGFLTRFTSGNNSQSLQWNHIMSRNYSTIVSAYRTAYRYNILNSFEENELAALSDIEDYGVRMSIRKDSLRYNGFVMAGVDWVKHAVSPNVINSSGTVTEFVESSATEGKVAYEMGAHIQYEFNPLPRWTINSGFRLSAAMVSAKNYFIPEPRISVRYATSSKQAIKFSYSRMAQYIHRISNSAVSAPTDLWYPVTARIRPQSSHQIALAWQKTFSEKDVYLSVEGYYKSMKDLIGYEQGTNLFLNNDFESKLIQGRGRSYGMEFLLKKDAGKLTGWLSYTLSWSWRQFDQIQPQWFPARYDRRHNGAVVVQYALNKRWSVSCVWEFISGSRFTPIIGQYVVTDPSLTGVELIPVYSEVNGVKLANSHRLDLGVKFRSKPERKFQWHWFVGVYNVYNRANPVGISIEQDEIDNSLHYTQPGLFGLLPFINYGFKL